MIKYIKGRGREKRGKHFLLVPHTGKGSKTTKW
jgi:hypothetical protein